MNSEENIEALLHEVNQLIYKLKSSEAPKSREISIAITQIETGKLWLELAKKENSR